MDDLEKLLATEYKTYVAVLEYRTEDGTILPRAITWEDGKPYEIDKVLDIRPAAALKAGGAGIRYTVRIQGKNSYRDTYLWLEENRFFVERRRPKITQ